MQLRKCSAIDAAKDASAAITNAARNTQDDDTFTFLRSISRRASNAVCVCVQVCVGVFNKSYKVPRSGV